MSYQIEQKIVEDIPQMSLASKSYIIAHESGNPNNTSSKSLDNEVNFMSNNWPVAFVHFWVGGGGRIVQIAADGFLAYGAGRFGNPHAPAQVELARTSDKETFLKDYAAYVWLLRTLAEKYGISRSLDVNFGAGIKTHKWISERLGGTDHVDPYDYLASFGITKERFAGDLAADAAADPVPDPDTSSTSGTLYRVQTGAFGVRENADRLADRMRAAGFAAIVVKFGSYYKVQTGAFAIRDNAVAYTAKVKAAGFDAYIVAAGESYIGAKQEHISLPSSATSWRVYPLDKPATVGNEIGYLNPALFGGLSYPVIRWADTNIAVIKTANFGEVKIYVGPGTGAVKYYA